MLMNIPYLRKTNAAFVEWILSQQNGLYFEGESVVECEQASRGISLAILTMCLPLLQSCALLPSGYGPLDQGAYNQFYENEIKGHPISKDFNAKPYQEFRPNARIVHLHG